MNTFLEQIREDLRIVDRRLAEFVRRMGDSHKVCEQESELRAFAGVYVSETEVLSLLCMESKNEPLAADSSQQQYRSLRNLSDRLQLSEFEIEIVLLALAAEIDRKYARVFAFLNNDMTRKHPSIGLAIDVFGRDRYVGESWLAFAEYSKLKQFALVEILQDDGPRANWLFRLTEGGLLRLLGLDASFQDLIPFSLEYPSTEVQEGFHWLPDSRSNCLIVTGLSGSDKSRAIESLARSRAIPYVSLDLSRLAEAPAETVTRVCRGLLRDCCLQPSLIHLQLSSESQLSSLLRQPLRPYASQEPTGPVAVGNTNPMREFRRLLTRLPRDAIVVVETDVPFDSAVDIACSQSEFHVVEFPIPSQNRRETYWTSVLRTVDPDNEDLAEPLSRSFRLSRSQIEIAAHQARHGNGGADAYWSAAASIASSGLSGIADRITPKAEWKDLVLDQTELVQLDDLVRRVRHREVVVREWGFDRRLSYGTGVNALFAGPPGTGKTMAAEVIASELRVPLFRVDCASVISKYIGETEKNLERIFNAAKRCDVVLFFDEADALFGKRTQVNDAHDRYANIETSYLLQRIERHEGIVVLATNLLTNIDNAFIRRLTQIVHFKAPDVEARERIWKKIWPAELPLSADLNDQIPNIARRFDLNGGAIKNAALTAAYLAADSKDSRVVQVDHVVSAIAQEYRKLGRSCDSFEWSATSHTPTRRSGVCT